MDDSSKIVIVSTAVVLYGLFRTSRSLKEEIVKLESRIDSIAEEQKHLQNRLVGFESRLSESIVNLKRLL
jgi:predicted  nucleic acid-binding Zn-ribbon protein